MDELVSVIISAYNEELSYIREALDSIINQTYKHIEIIFINDNPSRTDIDDAIKQYDSGIIKYFKNETNIGLANCMNKAAKLASGEYLARMDADDVSHNRRLEKEYAYLKENGLRIVSTGYSLIDLCSNTISHKLLKYNSDSINRIIPFYSPICHPTVMMEKSLFINAGGYNNYPCSQDYDLWLRLYYLYSVKFGYIDETLYFYRVREDSITARLNYRQYYTAVYQKKMIKKRVPFSIQDYESFMERKGINNDRKIQQFREYYNHHKSIKNNSFSVVVSRELSMLISSSIYRDVMINELKKRIIYRRFSSVHGDGRSGIG